MDNACIVQLDTADGGLVSHVLIVQAELPKQLDNCWLDSLTR